MSLEGLRAWIGEVERKLGKRTRVFLALAVIAIGLGGAAIYLAIDARESSVSEGDVQELQQELEAQIDAATGGATAAPIEPETETTPDAEPAPAPDAEPAPDKQGNGGPSGSGASGRAGTGGASNGDSADTVPGGTPDSAKIQELLERAKEQNAEAEADQAGK
jgi:hypothetical protein